MSKLIHDEQIKNYIENKSTRIFSNSNKDLFSILLNEVLKNSHEINWIITNLEKMKFFLNDEGFEKIESFLQGNKSLNIIVLNNSEQIINKFLNLSKKYKNLKFIKSDNLLNVQDVLTWDNIGYRFSPDTKRLTGVACANDKEFTSKCNNMFKTIMLKNIRKIILT